MIVLVSLDNSHIAGTKFVHNFSLINLSQNSKTRLNFLEQEKVGSFKFDIRHESTCTVGWKTNKKTGEQKKY
jgi:hypothetical protein